MLINWSIILLSILSPVLANPETVQRRKDININECRSVPESIREDCGYGGITRAGCVSRRCCFVTTSTPGVPWCFHTTHRTTTPAPTTTPTTPTTTTAITTTTDGHPEWLKNLLQTPKWTATTTIMTSQPGKNRLTDMLAKEIDNELKCQKTNRLFLRLSGASYCEVRTSDRVSCVTGVLERRRGQSACSACTSRNCCYDPVSKTVAGTPAPYCFKKKIEPTIPVPSTAQPSIDQSTRQQTTSRPLRQWSGIRPEFQPGATPSTNITYQSKRLAYMVN
uniref:P-type domain-containing protein n=1 Tax=Ciona savignyi TaxID=51511 RepID=H2YGE5_CIOSA